MVERLRVRLRAKSKVEVIRRGLIKLLEATEREYLEAAYKKASQVTLKSTREALTELDGLSGEGLDEGDK